MKEQRNPSEEWREAIATLPDEVFFSLIRMYLGELKTPYHKQTLIAELEAFLVRKENQEAAALLLSDTDRQILAAVLHIPRCTFEALISFFGKSIPYAALLEGVYNLEERLILFRRRDAESKQMTLAVSPAFEDMVRANAPLAALFPAPALDKTFPVAKLLTPSLLGAFFAYVTAHPDLCKINGEFKKRVLQQLQELFASAWFQDEGKDERMGTAFVLNYLLAIGTRLCLFRLDESGYAPNYAALVSFAALPHRERLAWFAASYSYRPSSHIRPCVAMLAALAESMPESGLTRTGFVRLALLKYDRFSRQSASEIMDLINAAVQIGLLIPIGETADGEAVYIPYSPSEGEEQEEKALSMDAGFSVTLFPGLPFATLARLLPFLDLTRYDTAVSYQLSRKSCVRGFDALCTPESMLALLQNACTHPLPQNLAASLEDWHITYSSVLLHHGYVLTLAEGRRAQFERNPALSGRIKKILAPGVYFCDFANDIEAARLIEKYLFVTIGKTLTSANRGIEYSEIEYTRGIVNSEKRIETSSSILSASIHYSSELRARLRELNFTPEQYDELLNRIERKIILSPEQFRPESVRLEKTAASGIDFLGKLRFIEEAVKRREPLEFGVGQEGAVNVRRIVGVPIWLTKRANDSFVTVAAEPAKNTEQYAVGKLRYVKKIRTSIFKDAR